MCLSSGKWYALNPLFVPLSQVIGITHVSKRLHAFKDMKSYILSNRSVSSSSCSCCALLLLLFFCCFFSCLSLCLMCGLTSYAFHRRTSLIGWSRGNLRAMFQRVGTQNFPSVSYQLVRAWFAWSMCISMCTSMSYRLLTVPRIPRKLLELQK